MCYYLPLEKGVVLHWSNLNLLHSEMLCGKFGWNSLSGSGEEVENVKRQTDGWTDRQTDKQQVIKNTEWQFPVNLLWYLTHSNVNSYSQS